MFLIILPSPAFLKKKKKINSFTVDIYLHKQYLFLIFNFRGRNYLCVFCNNTLLLFNSLCNLFMLTCSVVLHSFSLLHTIPLYNYIIHQFYYWWISGLFPVFSYFKYCCHEHSYTYLLVPCARVSLRIMLRGEIDEFTDLQLHEIMPNCFLHWLVSCQECIRVLVIPLSHQLSDLPLVIFPGLVKSKGGLMFFSTSNSHGLPYFSLAVFPTFLSGGHHPEML